MPDRAEPGRALMVMGCRRGCGASTVARELARLAAQRSARGIWLFDLDFAANSQAAAARAQGTAFDARFGRSPFWQFQTQGGQARVIARRSVVPNLYVTALQANPGCVKRIGLRPAPDYWTAVRQSIDLAIIDAPVNSTAPLSMVADMDGVILVADARDPNPQAITARQQAIEQRGGVVAGLIVNRDYAVRSAA